MKLKLTIQDMEVKDTGERYQGLFGTLVVKLPVSHGTDSVEQSINFATRVDAVGGLPAILENMIVEALALKKLERSDLIDDVQFEISMPNREQRRALKIKKPKHEQESGTTPHDESGTVSGEGG